MKRLIRTYVLFCFALVIAGAVSIQIIARSGVSGAIRKLGGSRSAYAEARSLLLLGTDNPAPALLSFSINQKHRLQARVDALTILHELQARQTFPIDSMHAHRLLSDTTTATLMFSLRILERAGTIYNPSAITALMATTTDTALFQQCWRTLKAGTAHIARPLDNPELADSATFERCISIISGLPSGKGRLGLRLAEYLAAQGQYARAQHFFSQLQPIDQWWIVGSWENRRMAAFHLDLPPEVRPFNSGDTFTPVLGETSRWFPWTNIAKDPWVGQWINLEDLFVRKLYSAAVLHTFMHVPTERDGLLLIGSDDGIVVRLNGQRVYEHKVFRPTIIDDDAVKVRLKAGVNSLTLKVLQDVGGWGVICRVTDLAGNPMPDLIASLSDTAPQVRNQTNVQRVIEHGPAQGEAVRLAADSELISALLRMVVDTLLNEKQRIRAVRTLRDLNPHRSVPVGETECIRAAETSLISGQESFLAELLGCLVEMQSRQAHQLVFRLESNPDPTITYYAGILSSADFRAPLLSAVSRFNTPGFDPAAVIREMDLEKCTDAWTIDQAATLHRMAGNPISADSIAALISMPRRWIGMHLANKPATTAYNELIGKIKEFGFDQIYRNSGERTEQSWAMPMTLDTLSNGYSNPFISHYPCPSGANSTVILVTEVASTREDSAWMCISLPMPFELRLNGVHVGYNRILNPHRYNVAGYIRQPNAFDIQHFPIRIRKGRNIITITSQGLCIGDRQGFFRCSFRDTQGGFLGCKDLTLQWRNP